MTTPPRTQASGAGLSLWLWGAAAAVIVACGSAGFIVQSLKPRGARPPMRAALHIDAVAPMPAPEPASKVVSLPAAVLKPVGQSLATDAVSAPPKAAPAPVSVTVVLNDKRYQSMVAAPAKFLAKNTMLGDAKSLRGFLSDPQRVDGYLNHPVIRGALASPTVVRGMLKPAVFEAFFTSAAMKDPRVVQALAESRLVKEIARAPGVQQALADPAFVQKVLLDPQAMAWLGRNPAAFKALSQFAPAFAAAQK